ncbi:MAG: hypothetical protein WCR27_04390 [Eubacteriales bacterium]
MNRPPYEGMPGMSGMQRSQGMPGLQGTPGTSGMQGMDPMQPPMHQMQGMRQPMPDYNRTMMQVMPAVKHSLKEIPSMGVKHAVIEASLISYLIGKGCDYYRALKIVESWEKSEGFSM